MIRYRPAVLARLDPRTLRPLPGARIRLRYGISGYGWSPDRSLLVLGDVDDDALHVVDPVAGRVLSRRPLPPAGLSAAAAGDRLVLLGAPLERIGPVRLLVADRSGRTRTVELSGISAGFQNPPDWDRPGAHGIERGAALAVDPQGGRAFVVAAGAPVAEVDLASLQVT